MDCVLMEKFIYMERKTHLCYQGILKYQVVHTNQELHPHPANGIKMHQINCSTKT